MGIPATIGVLLVAALVAAQFVDEARGCGSVDPTDPANYSTITIVNDTRVPIRVTNCRGTECSISGSSVLHEGQELTARAACAVSGKDMTSYEVDAVGTATVLGYIDVHVARSDAHPIYRISHVSPDRTSATPPS